MIRLPPPLVEVRSDFERWIRVVQVAVPPVIVTSLFRTREINDAAGGHPQSQHLLGLAADFVGTSVHLDLVAELARAKGYVPVSEADHLHVQVFPAGLLPALLFRSIECPC